MTTTTTPPDLTALLDGLEPGGLTTTWQRRIVHDMLAPGGPRRRYDLTWTWARSNDRHAADRIAIAAAVAFGHHVHVLARDGLWCVSPTVVGALWEKLQVKAPGPAAVIYDEPWPR